MNKAIYLLLLYTILPQIFCNDNILSQNERCGKEGDGTVNDEDYCYDRKLVEGEYRCCFVEFEGTFDGKKEEGKLCVPITKDQYDNIDDFIDAEKKDVDEGEKIDDYSIDCESNYIIISFLYLIVLYI